jgi:hypothetical protein
MTTLCLHWKKALFLFTTPGSIASTHEPRLCTQKHKF